MVPLQLEGMPSWLESLFTSEFAFAVLLGICILEGAMMLRFMPSELVVPAALALIGSSIPETVAIVAVAVVGTTIGQFLLFCLVRRAGREYVIQKRWFPLTEARLERFDGWFDRWGGIAVAGSNTMLVVRGLLTIPAGLSEMDGRTFVALSALGSLSFQSILAALYLFGGYLLAL
ncbi:SNARE associated Golgi protein-related protein [Haloterrigena turkmenica DSM 5511]|uniref:SNARE associated Golgi protein-related protein n=1 Tax=Haloterrigena turkmenica (strain ATCC 51198 / DSM 5511 / JCM 9101 / NCIMB 13204 / VKM B-1734 / 4k) TaxID=543526 RepID=D2RQK8_HALTV|nr:VTT domain-containing protein [Haloterrigena turkmenica]ADB62385.1 SNARE associated Golgi protein-related protein [Haloterrigena turkmenica DSM 5511]